jgi:hypothetical protein
MEVEAVAVRLDALRVINWLGDNALVTEETVQEGLACPHEFARLELLAHVRASDASVAEAIVGLVHSVSHAVILGLSSCSGMDLASFSEEILTGTLTTIIHAGDSSLGGLSSVFKQAPWQPLETSVEDLVICQLDPACTEDDGGACIGCIYLPIGCMLWNASLSRAYLYGGRTTAHGRVEEGQFVERGFWQ